MSAASPSRDRARLAVWAWCAVLLAACVIVYLPVYEAGFIFDDNDTILRSGMIRRVLPLSRFVFEAEQSPVSGRPLSALTFALNYHFGGLNPWGYHLVNHVLHALVGLCGFAVMLHALRERRWGGRFDRNALHLAGAAALLWVVHPLCTEAVAYVTQRTEQLAALFMLLTLFAAQRARVSHARWWMALSVIACLAGMACKEVVVVAPLLVVLYDWTFAVPMRSRRWFYVSLALTWPVLGFLVMQSPRSDSAGFGHGVSAWEYLMTQAGVVWFYLRLSVWPRGLSVWHEWPIARSLGDAWPMLGATAALLGVVIVDVVKRHAWGFCGAVFFLVLAPSSSVIPVVSEPVAERRMYLPLLAIAALVVVAAHVRPRAGAAAWLAVVVVCGVLTFQQAKLYADETALWRSAMAQYPHSTTARLNYGVALTNSGQYTDAAAHFEQLLRDDPTLIKAAEFHATALFQLGRIDAAALAYRRVAAARPRDATAHYNLGVALFSLDDLPGAQQAFTQATTCDPSMADAWFNLGATLEAMGKQSEAVACFERVLAIDPNEPDARARLEALR